ncbi:MAG TPA: hypothetical protein VJ224_03525 [Thermoplasmata archaeon]|nr:hypothetical protein [Thermoplasmata archaeon]
MSVPGMRTSGQCPKCNGRQVRVERFIPPSDMRGIMDFAAIPAVHPQRLLAYVCGSCGFVELYFAPQETPTPFDFP